MAVTNRSFATLAGLLSEHSGSISVFPMTRGWWGAQCVPPLFNEAGDLIMGRSQEGPTFAILDLNTKLAGEEWAPKNGDRRIVTPKPDVVIPLVSVTEKASIPVPESLIGGVSNQAISSAVRMYTAEVLTEGPSAFWHQGPLLDRQNHIEVAVRLPRAAAEAWSRLCAERPEARWEVSARLVRTLSGRVRRATAATLTRILEERKGELENRRLKKATQGTVEVFECPTEVSGPEVRYVPVEEAPTKVETPKENILEKDAAQKTRAQKAWETRRQKGNGGRSKEERKEYLREAAKKLAVVRVPDEMQGRELGPALRAWAKASEAKRAEVLRMWESTRAEIPYHKTRPTTLSVPDDAVREAFMASGSTTERGSMLFAFYKESQR